MKNVNNSTKYNGKLNVIGKKIKYYREKGNLSQQGLVNKLQLVGVDIPKNSLQRIEKGNRIIKDYELAGFAKVFKISADTLLEDFMQDL